MNNFKLEIKWGVIFVIMMLLWMVLERLVGLHDVHIDKHMIYTNFVAIPSILIYVLALREKRDHFYDGNMTYLEGLKSGVIITVVVALLSPLSQYITSTIITPDYFSNVISYSLETGYYSSLEEAQAYFNLENYIMQSAVGALIMGVLTSAIVAIFVKK